MASESGSDIATDLTYSESFPEAPTYINLASRKLFDPFEAEPHDRYDPVHVRHVAGH